MIFTILDDPHASLICNDCITEEQLDIGYSETELGACDECGRHGKRLWPSQPSMGIIIGLSMRRVEVWAREHGLAGNNRIHLYATDNTERALEGMRIEPECVILLPGSERGQCWYKFEQELLMARGLDPALAARSISAAQLASGTITSTSIDFTNYLNFQQYNRFLYGQGRALVPGKTMMLSNVMNP